MPITQDRLLDLIHVADEIKGRLEKAAKAADSKFQLAQREGAGSAPSPLLFQILEDLRNTLIYLYDGINNDCIETLTRERTHFKISQRNNARTARLMKISRERLGVEPSLLTDDEVRQHRPKPKLDLLKMQPIIYEAFMKNPNKDFSLNTPQLNRIIQQNMGLEDVNEQFEIVKQLIDQRVIKMPKIPGEFYLAD